MQQQQPQQQPQQQQQQLSSLVRRNFPPVDYGFAYGSGIFVQPDLYQGNARPMLDFIFVVHDPLAWHTENLQRNSAHYSFLKLLGPSMICRVADGVGVGVYFNTLVPLENQVVKYGVVGLDAFQQDLQHWSRLYVGGRLHKPVTAITPATPATEAMLQHNLRAALSTSLLLMPAAASFKDLFKRLTSLSYMGDVRMGLAEDSRKVERIVAGSYSHFKQLYTPLLESPSYQELGVQVSSDGLQQHVSPDYRVQLCSSLPAVLLARMAAKLGPVLKPPAAAAAAAVAASAAGSVSAQLPVLCQAARRDIAAAALKAPKAARIIKSALHGIVANSSRRQAVAGFLYAGPFRSLQYVGRKLAKAWR